MYCRRKSEVEKKRQGTMSNSLKWLSKARENPCVRSEIFMRILRAGYRGFQSSGCWILWTSQLGSMLSLWNRRTTRHLVQSSVFFAGWIDTGKVNFWSTLFFLCLMFLFPWNCLRKCFSLHLSHSCIVVQRRIMSRSCFMHLCLTKVFS